MSKIIAILIPNKDPTSHSRNRQISLLSILFKLFERIILIKLVPLVDHLISPDQAGFLDSLNLTKRTGSQLLSQTAPTHLRRKLSTSKLFNKIVTFNLPIRHDILNHPTKRLKSRHFIRKSLSPNTVYPSIYEAWKAEWSKSSPKKSLFSPPNPIKKPISFFLKRSQAVKWNRHILVAAI
ncbi:hypothetical protein RF11_03905 [Thelohanellus kitauei]|uniref:Reverse transcriptase domain-containing protein n=1 Tax=Thelohanellus kitauei TaxID=669202 RepID=A0A0C2J6H8_THEKT|nr:hypothetical protein RF11_03905 [Thelohanellus kitauei]